MATDLVGNVKLQRFIELLAELNHLSADAVRSGKLELLPKMNSVIKEMHSIQSVGEEEAYTAIEDDAQMIYKNFDAAAQMLKSNENGNIDGATNAAVKMFLKNIFTATVNIIHAYGLA
jgi:hypothetical protein